MRLDHIAYRVADRKKSAQFFIDAFGYSIQTEFDLEFDDNSTTKCIALEAARKTEFSAKNRIHVFRDDPLEDDKPGEFLGEYHLAPELFVSDGSPDSIVGKWVAARGGIGGIHHVAYEVKSVRTTMRVWQQNGWAEFASNKPLVCPGLVQVFTAPHPLTGVVYEFIERKGEYGFCIDNVKDLMTSTDRFQ